MDVKHIAALVAIDDHGSFSAAADHLGTVQSNVSAHVARLEREVGAVLVDRSTGRLTDEGVVVVSRGRRVLAELDAVVADVAACRDEVAGTVRVGMIGTTARWLVPQILEVVRARHPRLRLVVVEGTSTGLEPQLVTGALDVAVMNLPVGSRELVASDLFEEDLMLVVDAGHPLATEGPTVPAGVLAELELLLPLPGTSFRDELDAAVLPQGIALLPTAEIDGVRLIASLTFEGHGPAVLPATAVPAHLRDRFVQLAVEGLPRRRIGVAQRSRGIPPAPVRTVIGLLQSIVASDELPVGLHPTASPATGAH